MFGKIRRASGKRHPSSGGALLGLMLLAGCAAGGFEGRWLGAGGEWVALDINGVPVLGAAPTFTLAAGRASGTGGCNTFSAAYRTQSRERFEVTGLASTRKLCDPAAMDQESRYFSILSSVQGYNFYSNGDMSLIAGDGRAIRFRKR